MKNGWMRKFGLKRRSLGAIALFLVLALLASAFPPAEMFRVKEAKAADYSYGNGSSHGSNPVINNNQDIDLSSDNDNRIFYDYGNSYDPHTPTSGRPKVIYLDTDNTQLFSENEATIHYIIETDNNNQKDWFYVEVKRYSDFNNTALSPSQFDHWRVRKTTERNNDAETIVLTFTAVKKDNPAPAATTKPVYNPPAPVQTPYQYKYYNITYELDGGTNDPHNPATYREDETITLKDAWKTGAKFDGWYLTPEGTGAVVTISNRNITVYAHFTPYEYKINYDLAGGIMETGNPDKYKYGEATALPKEPTRDGSVFTGWSLSPLGTDPFKSLPAGCSGDLMLYAVWESAATNEIVFDTESFRGATNPNAELTTFATGEAVTLNYIKPEDPGYPGIQVAFKGYEYKFEGDVNWIPAPLVTGKEDQATIDTTNHHGTLTIRAVWGEYDEELPYTKISNFYGHIVRGFNMLNKDDYAVCYVEGRYENADPRYFKIIEGGIKDVFGNMMGENYEGNKYFELCEVDESERASKNGNPIFGLKLKDDVTADQLQSIADNENKHSLFLRVRGIDTNGKLNDHYDYVYVSLSDVRYELPEYNMDKHSTIIPYKIYDNEKPADIHLRETSGYMPSDCGDGEWKLDYVDSDGETILDYMKIKHDKNSDFSMSADWESITDETEGKIRISNTRWVSGAAVDVNFNVKTEKTSRSRILTPDKKNIVLNNQTGNDSETVRLTINDTYIPDMDMVTCRIDNNKIKYEVNSDGTIKFTCAKGTTKNTYTATIEYRDEKRSVYTCKLQIKVMSTSAKSAMELENAYGYIDAIADTQVYIRPKIKGFGGEIESVSVKKNQKYEKEGRWLYKAKWDGRYIILSKKKSEFVYQVGGYEETIRATLTSGEQVYGKIKIVPKATNSIEFYGNDFRVSRNASDSTVTSRLYCNYKYRYGSPRGENMGILSLDLDDPDTFLIQNGKLKPKEKKVFYIDPNYIFNYEDNDLKTEITCAGSLITARIIGPASNKATLYNVNCTAGRFPAASTDTTVSCDINFTYFY